MTFRRNSPHGFLSLIFVVLAGLSASAQSQESLDPVTPRDIAATLQSIVAKRQVPGMVAVVLQGDRIVAQGAAGVRKADSPERITINDSFLLCSGTKAMTATLVAMAVDEGKLRWDSTVGDVLQEAFPHMRSEWKPITLLQLMEHRGGAPADTDELGRLLRVHLLSHASPEEKRRQVITSVFSHPPRYSPGREFVYSNTGYFMVTAMLEKAMGVPWEQLVRARLWMPLGISSGGVGPPGDGNAISQPWGHGGPGSWRHDHSITPDGFLANLTAPAFYGPVGTVHMSVLDWSRFIALHLRGDTANPHREVRLIGSSSFETLHRAPATMQYQAGWFFERHDWAKGDRPGDTGRVLRSLGDTGYWHVDAVVAPEIDFGIVCTVNQGGAAPGQSASSACNDVASAMEREFLERTEKTGRSMSGLAGQQ